ncbi:kinase-like domain-containing protein [Gigaspora rosea]|uniref:Kinase-like domain-containing protein n=1 Tax=Gigaspora rosea TaxID=44941 RepID=A0A397UEV5_9GLOM|nr:kinase-like domain-containing protein [Gigaspora rosea]
MRRQSYFRTCGSCKQYNTFYAWCQTCDPKTIIQGWSNSDVIDNLVKDCIKEFQREAIMHDEVIEWIPFDRLKEIKYIAEGGYGSVFSAIWLDGMRVTEYTDGNWVRSRKESSTVALKTWHNAQDPSECLKEFKNHMQYRLMGSELEIYGLTKSTKDNELLKLKAGDYLMVLQFADSGSLNKFLKNKFKELTGNILQNKIGETIFSYIADLGLSKKIEADVDEAEENNEIYGVLPYVAPEVLVGKKYTRAADIYGLGIMMAEMSSGQRPFDGHEFNTSLAVKIIRGLRPDFAHGTPTCYIRLAKKYIDQDPQKRPTANEISSKLYHLWCFLHYTNKFDKLGIKEKFLSADKFIEKLPIIERKHQDSMYTSKIINTRQIKDSKQLDLKISDISS